ncbi:MAG TPA: ferrochelatase [Bdellovibrionota bacterium]|jgi:ferrochelatase|nr:ferrochelatase [Bdellovibrionota bacterium]
MDMIKDDVKSYVAPTQRALLLLNLGSPASPSVPHVRRYLREFLMDPYVIDVPWIKRFFLVNGIIAPLRAPKSAKAYAEIWTDEGSPLVLTTESLGRKVQAELGEAWIVKVGMRYGEPSMQEALRDLQARGITEVHVLPLYPQYALSSTESVRAKLHQDLKKLDYHPRLTFREFFYDDPGYYETFAEIIDQTVAHFRPDAVLFSYHGIPERHLHKIDPSGHHPVDREECCSPTSPTGRYCYRAHCVQSTKSIRAAMKTPALPFHISYQSRLGKDPWIKPYTDHVAIELAKAGVKRLAVASPAFVADCLETLEEIAGELRESFIEAGGEDLRLIPSLNDSDRWARVIAQWYSRDN